MLPEKLPGTTSSALWLSRILPPLQGILKGRSHTPEPSAVLPTTQASNSHSAHHSTCTMPAHSYALRMVRAKSLNGTECGWLTVADRLVLQPNRAGLLCQSPQTGITRQYRPGSCSHTCACHHRSIAQTCNQDAAGSFPAQTRSATSRHGRNSLSCDTPFHS